MLDLKKQLASFLSDAARDGISKLDSSSPLAKQLKGLNVDDLLKEDIQQICKETTFPEMVRIMSLGAQIKMGTGDTDRIKEDLKKMARAIEQRVESRQVKLNTPVSCRDLLYNL